MNAKVIGLGIAAIAATAITTVSIKNTIKEHRKTKAAIKAAEEELGDLQELLEKVSPEEGARIINEFVNDTLKEEAV